MKTTICALLLLSACAADNRPVKPIEVEPQETDCLDALAALGVELEYTGNSDLHVRASALPAVFDKQTGAEIQSDWYYDASFSFHEFCERMSERVVVNSLTGDELNLTNFFVVP